MNFRVLSLHLTMIFRFASRKSVSNFLGVREKAIAMLRKKQVIFVKINWITPACFVRAVQDATLPGYYSRLIISGKII